MKQTIKFYVVITVLIFSCEIKENRTNKEVIKDDTLYIYNNDTLVLKVPLVNGMKNGEAYSFGKNGIVIRISTFVNDTIQGFVNEYYESGILKSEAYYLKGKKFAEYHEYYDGYQDSTAILRNGTWWIVPYPTKVKKYEFYDLREKVAYYRYYDEDGKLIDCKGRLFQAKLNNNIIISNKDSFSQGWITPSPYQLKQLSIKQYYVISSLSDLEISNDTVYSDFDSTVTRWKYKILNPGKYKFQAIAYLYEKGIVETDTSYFNVIVTE